MAQFAEKIRGVGAAYLDHPVVDQTNLKGAYNFVVSWSPLGRLMGGGKSPEAAGSDATPAAADRPVGFTLFEALDKQLGLKLSAQKHPMPAVVIDHVERQPTGNYRRI